MTENTFVRAWTTVPQKLKPRIPACGAWRTGASNHSKSWVRPLQPGRVGEELGKYIALRACQRITAATSSSRGALATKRSRGAAQALVPGQAREHLGLCGSPGSPRRKGGSR